METNKKAAVWPVMLTPFTEEGEVDYPALKALIGWYEKHGVGGLFAVCQSSEMFFLSLRERIAVARFVKENASVPVVASGHISAGREDQVEELSLMAETGVDAVILLTNRLAERGAPPERWMKNLEYLLKKLDKKIPLGLYECPYPFKWLLSDDELSFCAKSGRFRFLKDTSCDISILERRISLARDTALNIYNADTSTLLDSLRAGAAGFSGVMANFHPELYVWLTRNWRENPEKAKDLQSFLFLCSQIENQCYPINAKFHLHNLGILPGIHCRSKNSNEWCATFESEVAQMNRAVDWFRKHAGV